MTYQGARVRPAATEAGRYFMVSKVRLSADGHVSDVLWDEVNPRAGQSLGASVLATAAEVVDAIHDGAQVEAVFADGGPRLGRRPERAFVVVKHEGGRECLSFNGAVSPGRSLGDIDKLDA